MYGIYLRLDIIVHDGWRAVVRAAARKLTQRALRDPKHRAARKQFYRQMLDYHRQEQDADLAPLTRPPSDVIPHSPHLVPALRRRSVGPSHVQENQKWPTTTLQP